MTDPSPAATSSRAPSRRGFLRGSLALGGAAALTVAHGTAFTSTSYAATGVADQVLVVLSMRGALRRAQPRRAARRPGLLRGPARDRGPVRPAAGQGRLLRPAPGAGAAAAAVERREDGRRARHRAARSRTGRHFSAMEEVEDADPGSTARVGWLNRLVGRDGDRLAARGHPDGRRRADRPRVPGPQPVAGHPERRRGPARRADGTTPRRPPRRAVAADRVGRRDRSTLAAGLRSALDVGRRLRAGARHVRRPRRTGPSTPTTDLAAALAAVGADDPRERRRRDDHRGPRLVGPPHRHRAPPTCGEHATARADEFAGAIAAFFADLGPLADKVTVVTISEFGRRVKENANQGLDHGYGNVMFVDGRRRQGRPTTATGPG